MQGIPFPLKLEVVNNNYCKIMRIPYHAISLGLDNENIVTKLFMQIQNYTNTSEYGQFYCVVDCLTIITC